MVASLPSNATDGAAARVGKRADQRDGAFMKEGNTARETSSSCAVLGSRSFPLLGTPRADKLLTAYDFVRVVLSILLLVAAALKGHQLATSPLAETGPLTSRWLLIVVVEIELALGLWLLVGALQPLARHAAITCFTVFGAVSLLRALNGASTCGCFGSVAISPWWTAALDAAAVASLLLAKPTPGSNPQKKPYCRLALHLILLIALGVPAAIVMAGYRPAALTAGGEILRAGQTIVLEPETWLGKPFPLIRHIDIGARLADGHWTVVFYHHDCPACHEVISSLRASRDDHQEPGERSRVALVQVPPVGLPLPEDSSERAGIAAQGALDADHDWFIATPVTVSLASGVVVRLTLPDSLSPAPSDEKDAATTLNNRRT